MERYSMHFINGKWIEGKGPPFTSINPATGEVLGETLSASNSDVNICFNAADKAFTTWKNVSIKERIVYLKNFSHELKLKQNELTEAISLETGKPLWESNQEVNSMIGKISISIDSYAQRCPQQENKTATALSITRHKPHGTIIVLGPFNFPGHLPNGHIVPALLAGNTVIFKPSEYTPYVGILMAKCWENSQLPPGVFNLVQGGQETGQALISLGNIKGVFFTGSWSTGKILLEKFASKPEVILVLEMGGNNPLVVSKISNMQAAAYATIQSAYLTTGQRCSCARRLILLANASSESFLSTLIKMISSIQIGPYTMLPEPFMGPVISYASAKKILEKQDQLEKKGGISLLKCEWLKEKSGFISPGLMDVTAIQSLPDEEIFGPFLQLIKVKNLETAIEIANNTEYGLSAGLLSDDPREYEEFYRNVKAGVINWNSPLTGASSSAPFGGIGKSGNHRPSAFYAADYSSYPVASIESLELKMPETLPIGIKSI